MSWAETTPHGPEPLFAWEGVDSTPLGLILAEMTALYYPDPDQKAVIEKISIKIEGSYSVDDELTIALYNHEKGGVGDWFEGWIDEQVITEWGTIEFNLRNFVLPPDSSIPLTVILKKDGIIENGEFYSLTIENITWSNGQETFYADAPIEPTILEIK